MGISALQAAKVACESSGWTLTNLQLQKILYIAHMLYAGRHEGERLIEGDNFEAWSFGPVLPIVYHHVSAFGSRPIGNVFRRIEDPCDGPAATAIREAVEKLSSIPPFRLVDITHSPRSAWDRNYQGGVLGIRIPQEDILAEYQHRFVNV